MIGQSLNTLSVANYENLGEGRVGSVIHPIQMFDQFQSRKSKRPVQEIGRCGFSTNQIDRR